MRISDRWFLWLVLAAGLLFHAFLAFWLELGNDEVYYRTYALFPDWSYFDHPPMLGWVIRLFSWNLYFQTELALRFSSVIFFAINTLLIVEAGRMIRDERTGLYAALLYNASLYASVVTGVFILPDTPQNLFWMLALVLALNMLDPAIGLWRRRQLLMLFGLVAGLSMISKYTGVFLWVGWLGFVLLYRRQWLKDVALYGALLLSALCVLPVVIWNIHNDFISFSFQGNRVHFLESGLRPDLLITELAGQILYNNPVNWLLIVGALIALVQHKLHISIDYQRFIILLTVPFIAVFLFFSLFKPTLPHWTGPAYNTLILLAAVRLRQQSLRRIPGVIYSALGFFGLVVLVGSLQIKTGFIPIKTPTHYHLLGKDDVSLDMYGWRLLKKEFETLRNQHIAAKNMQVDDPLVADFWFPLANLDYYVAYPLQMKVFGIGGPERIHHYHWIQKESGGLPAGSNCWYITDSRNYKHPEEAFHGLFESILVADTININRGGRPAKRVFVFMLQHYSPPSGQ